MERRGKGGAGCGAGAAAKADLSGGNGFAEKGLEGYFTGEALEP